MERILSDHGYAVVTAAHPQEALELASSLPRIDLLLTDVVMPGMSGTRLAEKLRDARPEMRVLFTTGYTARPERLPEGADILSKPFTPNELLSRAGAQ
jgi:CheY-like chemotaxis protein